ncbi:hypothetical protein CCP3SC15_4220002 [Gammaproteobacteria bacterium]
MLGRPVKMAHNRARRGFFVRTLGIPSI